MNGTPSCRHGMIRPCQCRPDGTVDVFSTRTSKASLSLRVRPSAPDGLESAVGGRPPCRRPRSGGSAGAGSSGRRRLSPASGPWPRERSRPASRDGSRTSGEGAEDAWDWQGRRWFIGARLGLPCWPCPTIRSSCSTSTAWSRSPSRAGRSRGTPISSATGVSGSDEMVRDFFPRGLARRSGARPARPLRGAAGLSRTQGTGRSAGGVRRLLVPQKDAVIDRELLAMADAWRQRTGGRVFAATNQEHHQRRLSPRSGRAGDTLRRDHLFGGAWRRRKPEQVFFTAAQARMGSSTVAQSILFVDDSAANVDGARMLLGWRAMLYRDRAQPRQARRWRAGAKAR